MNSTFSPLQNLLRLSFGSTGPGQSPDAAFQPHSLPSSVSDALEAMVGGGLDDLTMEDIETSDITEEHSEVITKLSVIYLLSAHD